jgi:hypothetical protein
MTGANYLTNRDATNRKPIEDDKWTDIHLPLYAEIWSLHAKKGMSRSSSVTQAMDLRCHGGRYSKFCKDPAMAEIYCHCRYVMQRTPSNTFSWNVATPRQTKDEDVWSKRCGKCWQRSVQAM